MPNTEDFEGVDLRRTCLDTTRRSRLAEQLLQNVFSADEWFIPSLERDYMQSYKTYLLFFAYFLLCTLLNFSSGRFACIDSFSKSNLNYFALFHTSGLFYCSRYQLSCFSASMCSPDVPSLPGLYVNCFYVRPLPWSGGKTSLGRKKKRKR